MKKGMFVLIFAMLLAMLLVSFSSARLLTSGTTDKYNLGDVLSLNVKELLYNDLQGFVDIKLVCDSSEKPLYFSPVKFQKEQEKTFAVSMPLALKGNCYVRVLVEDQSYAAVEETKTPTFIVTDELTLEATMNKEFFQPGDQLKLDVNVKKANGAAASGTAEVLVDDVASSMTFSGTFSFTKNLEKNMKPGKHNLVVSVQDANGNKGRASTVFEVAVVPTSLAIEHNVPDGAAPGSDVSIIPRLLDQANQTVAETVVVRITYGREAISENMVPSGGILLYKTQTDTAPGQYTIEASCQSFTTKKTFQINKLEKISMEITDGVLNIANTGNVPYTKPVEVTFSGTGAGGDMRKIINLDVAVDGKASYKLEAPDGTYDVNLNSASESKKFTQIPLTGQVIATVELGKKQNDWVFLPFVVLVIAIIIIAYFFIKDKFKTKRFRGKGIPVVISHKERMPLPKHLQQKPGKDSGVRLYH